MGKVKIKGMIVGIAVLCIGVLIYGVWRFGPNYYSDRLYVHYVIQSWWEVLQTPIKEGYTDQVAYKEGDVQHVFLNARSRGLRTLYVYDILGNPVDSVEWDRKRQQRIQDPAVQGFGYRSSLNYPIPHLPGGLYTWEKVVPFLIRGSDTAGITLLYPSHTIQAYNVSGGKSFYSMFSQASDTISYLRPTFPAVSFMVREMLSWLYAQDLAIRYISDVDMEVPGILSGTKLLIVIGHSEYWSAAARGHYDAFIQAGGNALILSGNTMWWKVRYLADTQQLICFKQENDPHKGTELQTGNWSVELGNDPLTSIGVSFGLGGYGRKYQSSRGGFSIPDTTHILFKGVRFSGKAFIHVPTKEYDGQYVLPLKDGFQLDDEKQAFHRIKLLGYDRASVGYEERVATAIAFQPRVEGGVIINFPTTDWASAYGIGGKDGEKIKRITLNAIELLRDQRNIDLLWE